MSGEPGEDRLQRLDPDRAAAAARPSKPARPAGRPPAPAEFDPRRYQWIAGAIALLLVIIFSVIQLTAHGAGTAGVPPGRRVHLFAAPLASSNLIGDANLRPPCTPARHDPRALNLCLVLQRGPLVLGFFVADSGSCKSSVDAMQAVSSRFEPRGVQFAAIAVHADRAAAAAAVRKRGWTIPVAYDRDGAVGQSYGVEVCPLLELVRQDGVVAARLIGKRWNSPSALAAQVQQLIAR